MENSSKVDSYLPIPLGRLVKWIIIASLNAVFVTTVFHITALTAVDESDQATQWARTISQISIGVLLYLCIHYVIKMGLLGKGKQIWPFNFISRIEKNNGAGYRDYHFIDIYALLSALHVDVHHAHLIDRTTTLFTPQDSMDYFLWERVHWALPICFYMTTVKKAGRHGAVTISRQPGTVKWYDITLFKIDTRGYGYHVRVTDNGGGSQLFTPWELLARLNYHFIKHGDLPHAAHEIMNTRLPTPEELAEAALDYHNHHTQTEEEDVA